MKKVFLVLMLVVCNIAMSQVLSKGTFTEYSYLTTETYDDEGKRWVTTSVNSEISSSILIGAKTVLEGDTKETLFHVFNLFLGTSEATTYYFIGAADSDHDKEKGTLTFSTKKEGNGWPAIITLMNDQTSMVSENADGSIGRVTLHMYKL